MKSEQLIWNLDTGTVQGATIQIPAEVFFCPNLTPNARLLYGLLNSSEEYRSARNIELAQLLQLKGPQPITNAISKLRRLGFIKVEYQRKGKFIIRGQYDVDFDSQWSRNRRIQIVLQNKGVGV